MSSHPTFKPPPPANLASSYSSKKNDDPPYISLFGRAHLQKCKSKEEELFPIYYKNIFLLWTKKIVSTYLQKLMGQQIALPNTALLFSNSYLIISNLHSSKPGFYKSLYIFFLSMIFHSLSKWMVIVAKIVWRPKMNIVNTVGWYWKFGCILWKRCKPKTMNT